MKKRTLGRIAAVGLAGLTAVPAMAMVASADVSYDSRDQSISGSAYRLSWTAQKTDTTWAVLATQFNGTVTLTYTHQDFTGPMTANDPITVGNEAYPLNNTMMGSGAVYIANSTGLTTYQNNIKQLVQTQDVYADNAYNNWKKGWDDYKADYEAWYSAKEFVSSSINENAERTVTSKKGIVVKINKSNCANSYESFSEFSQIPNSNGTDSLSIWKYTCTPVTETKTMRQLADEVGDFVYVNQTTGVISSESQSGGIRYKVNTNSSSSPVTGGTTTGSYGAYEVPAGYRYASSVSYFSNVTGSYYPNLAALYAAAGTGTSYSTKTPSPAYSTTYCYFDPVNGNYITSSQYSNGYYPYAVYVSAGTVTSNTENAIYYVNGLYYYTWSSAYSAAGNDASKVQYIRDYSSLGNYFSRTTGQFYSTYESALSASGGISSRVIVLNGYADDYYYGNDPYYLYFLNMNNSNNNNSSSSLGGSSVKIGNKSGWTNVRSQIRKASSGSTLDVSLNGEVVIPEEILSALAGKNVTVNFKLPNGAVVSYNGQNISGVKDVNVAVQYNTKNVPSGLVKKATSVNNSLSTSQISVSSNTLAGSASVTVKYSTNRAGCTAKIYRYNASRNSLQLVDTSTVASNGKVTFDGMKQGGDFVIVLFN